MEKEEGESKKPHVGILPSQGMGNFIPLLELAKRLVLDRGFQVTFIPIATAASSAQNHLLRTTRMLHPDLHIVELPPVATDSSIVPDDTPILTRLCITNHESLRSLKPLLLNLPRPIKALIVEIFTTEAFDVCRELSIPAYSFYTGSASLLALSLYLPTLDREVAGEFVDLPNPVQVPGCSPIRTEDLFVEIRNRKSDDYKWYLFHAKRLSMAAGILSNTWSALEPNTLQALNQNPFFQNLSIPPIYPIGPLIREDEPVMELHTTLFNWLDTQPVNSVLLVSFGSGGTLSSEQFTELAWGLEMSRQRFVLVAREPNDRTASGMFDNVGVDGTLPAEYLPAGFLERTKGVGRVVAMWVPQVAVLRHLATGGFLSHCGWNSCLESVVHGVPMIAWPLYAEQRMNATMMAEEIGMAVKPTVSEGGRVIGRKEVERVVRLVMEGEGEEGKALRKKAEELQENAKKVSYDSLHSLVL